MGEEPTAMRPVDQPVTGQTSADGDPAKIRAEIVETRAEMSETIDAIQEKLSPQRLMDDAKQNVRDATVGKVTTMVNTVTDRATEVGEQVQDQARQAVTYVRDNPIPALLIGAGVTWLLMRSRTGSSAYSGYGGYGGRSTYSGYPAGSRYRVREDTTTGPGSAASWTETASEATERLQQRVSDYGRSAETTLERWLRENPLTVGTVALAAGAVVGLGLPRTRTEDAWMGEARDTLVERAQETAQQAVERVGDVAEQVQQSASDVRQAAGDVGEQLGGTGTGSMPESPSRAKTSGARGA
jgi:ElaB/YqjD/DUF883 family membrane-anchored ribosome-binding protein